jgi:antirestriction protein ArdC
MDAITPNGTYMVVLQDGTRTTYTARSASDAQTVWDYLHVTLRNQIDTAGKRLKLLSRKEISSG